MRCTLVKEECIVLGVAEVATKASEKKTMVHDVPPDLLNALQRADREYARVQQAVLDHLRETKQDEPGFG